MRRAFVSAAAAVVVAALGLGIPAGAHHTSQTDPNDTPGRFDLRAVQFGHAEVPRWTFVTFAGWRVPEVWDRGYLVVRLDTRGDGAVDRLIVLRSDGRELVGTLYRVRADGSQAELGNLPAGKAGSRGASVAVALHKLAVGRPRTSYFWSAQSGYTDVACPRTCIDLVPDEGMVEQVLPGVTPSPTPTPTPTVTPTPSPTPSPSPS